MDLTGEVWSKIMEYGISAILLFLGARYGLPWLLKRDKVHNDEKNAIYEQRLTELKESQSTTQQMALTFNDTVNKFNATIEGHTKQMETHTKQIEKISESVSNLATSVSNVLDRTAQNQYEQLRLREDNQRILDRINTTSDLIQQLTKQTK